MTRAQPSKLPMAFWCRGMPAAIQAALRTESLSRPGVVDAAYAEYHGDEWGLYSMRMIRTRTAKYVYSPHGTDELYDLEADPHELVNRVEDPSYSGLRDELRGRLIAWMIETDDPLALWARRVL